MVFFSQSHYTRIISCHSYNLNIMSEIKSYKYILHLHIYTYTEVISTLEPSFSIPPPPSFQGRLSPAGKALLLCSDKDTIQKNTFGQNSGQVQDAFPVHYILCGWETLV